MTGFRGAAGVWDDRRVFEVTHDHTARRVEAWSEVRLPFEPRGEALELRGHIRQALATLRPAYGEVLHAVYTSESDGFVDTENVLLYNVGAAALRNACAYGLRFERRFGKPRPPRRRGGCRPTTTRTPSRHPRNRCPIGGASERIAGWPDTPLPGAAFHAPAPAWLAARRALAFDGVPAAPGSSFELSLQVTGRVSPASAVKPLFDGVIAALHAHDGTSQAEVLRRLGPALDVSAPDLATLLSGAAPLGVRTLVRLRGAGLQWNPEDERCAVGGLAFTPGAPSFSGEVWEVAPHDCNAEASA